MRIVRSILRIVLIFSILVWVTGFMMGNNPDKPLYWQGATIAVWGAAGSIALLILTLPFGLNLPAAQPRKLKKRASDHYGKGIRGASTQQTTSSGRCLDCGRPVVPGSNYCRYHTDIRKDERGRGNL